jgi:hypothetical protein
VSVPAPWREAPGWAWVRLDPGSVDAGPDQLRLWCIWAALWVGIAVGVVVVGGPQLGRDPAAPARVQGQP